MKALAWYCRVVFSLFILVCLALAISLLMRFSPQALVGVAVLVIYGVLTSLCFNGTESVLRKSNYDKKRWGTYGIIWTAVVILLPFILLLSTLSHETVVLFTILSAMYEWNFIAISLLMALLFIPAIVFFARYLARTRDTTQ